MARFFFIQHQNMEVLVGSDIPTGGSAVQTVIWMQALKELGHDILQGKLQNDTRELMKEFSWVSIYPLYHPKKNRKRFSWYTHRLPSIFKTLKNSQCDVLYESIPQWYSIYLGIFCKILKIKHVIRVANDNMMDERILLQQSKLNRFFIFLGLRISDNILVQNDYQYQSLKKRFPKKNILKIFNPIVLNKDLMKNKSEMKGYIAWAANFRYQKNLKMLYEIAAILPEENFKIAGSPKFPLDNETSEFYEKLQKLSNVKFVGNLSRLEIFDFYSKAKFLLNTSRYEGFSNTFLESLLVGTPILTTSEVNPDRIIEKFNIGYLYQNAEDLKKTINAISNDEYLLKTDNCIKYLKNNHDHLILGKIILKFLEVGEYTKADF